MWHMPHISFTPVPTPDKMLLFVFYLASVSWLLSEWPRVRCGERCITPRSLRCNPDTCLNCRTVPCDVQLSRCRDTGKPAIWNLSHLGSSASFATQWIRVKEPCVHAHARDYHYRQSSLQLMYPSFSNYKFIYNILVSLGWRGELRGLRIHKFTIVVNILRSSLCEYPRQFPHHHNVLQASTRQATRFHVNTTTIDCKYRVRISSVIRRTFI